MNAKVWMASAAIAGGLLGGLTSQATAHTAVVSCGDSVDNPFLVTSQSPEDVVTGWNVTPGGVEVTWSDGFQDPLNPYPVPTGCTYPSPAPSPQPPEQVPVELPPVVMPPPTCQELLALYPKAGPVRRRAWGCPMQKPPIRRPRSTPVVVDCQFVLSHYSGQARKNMIRKHNIARSCGRPFNPPVAG